jgi:hypothetical protein
MAFKNAVFWDVAPWKRQTLHDIALFALQVYEYVEEPGALLCGLGPDHGQRVQPIRVGPEADGLQTLELFV